MEQSLNQLVTLERFNAGIASLHARVDTVKAEMRADFMRSVLIAVGIVIAANALTITILSILMSDSAGI